MRRRSSRATGSNCPRPSRARSTDPSNESPKPGDPAFATTEFKLIARPADAFRAVEDAARKAGYEPVMLGDRVEGEARAVAAEHAARALELQKQGRRAVLLSGGELTVTIRGKGRGGPNQEYALALAHRAARRPRHLGAGRRHRRHRRRRRAPPATRPGRRSTEQPWNAPARLASIRPSFLRTTTPPGFSPGSATSWKPARPAPT